MNSFFERVTGIISGDDKNIAEDSPKQEKDKEANMSMVKKENSQTSKDSQDEYKLKVHTVQEESDELEEGELTVDIYDDDDAIVVLSTVAGVDKDNIDVTITGDTVEIRGTRLPLVNIPENKYYYKELFWGNFYRSIILPEEIDPEKVEAHLKNGLLAIRLPKKRQDLPQKVKIKAG